jgi:O6-methylguanine-DNA--protein-cysteine methyltransferase
VRPKAASGRAAARDPRPRARPEDPMSSPPLRSRRRSALRARSRASAAWSGQAARGRRAASAPRARRGGAHARARARRVRELFRGLRAALAALTVDPHGSEFQRRVWRALREIPPARPRATARSRSASARRARRARSATRTAATRSRSRSRATA